MPPQQFVWNQFQEVLSSTHAYLKRQVRQICKTAYKKNKGHQDEQMMTAPFNLYATCIIRYKSSMCDARTCVWGTPISASTPQSVKLRSSCWKSPSNPSHHQQLRLNDWHELSAPAGNESHTIFMNEGWDLDMSVHTYHIAAECFFSLKWRKELWQLCLTLNTVPRSCNHAWLVGKPLIHWEDLGDKSNDGFIWCCSCPSTFLVENRVYIEACRRVPVVSGWVVSVRVSVCLDRMLVASFSDSSGPC